MPYTYLIGWTSLDLWYYGVRYAPGCSPDEFWQLYFTSSEVVKRVRVEHGEPDVIEVRHTFSSPHAARCWEERVLRRMGAVRSPRWLNLQNSGKEFNSTGEETRAKMSKPKAKKRGPMREEHKSKIAAWHRTKVVSDETKEKLRQANLGKAHSVESNAKRSLSLSGALNPNFGGRLQTDEVKARMRKPKADSSKMGKWERTPEWRAAVAETRRGKKLHVSTDGARKMFVPGAAPPGWIIHCQG